MATYTTTKVGLDEISQRSEQNRKKLEQAKALINSAISDLTAMGTTYADFVSQLNIDAAANSGDAAWEAALAEKNELQADFQAEKSRAVIMQTAVSGL